MFLFDLTVNNFERKNVAAENKDIVDELMKVYDTWEKDLKDPLWPGVMEIKFDINGAETWWSI